MSGRMPQTNRANRSVAVPCARWPSLPRGFASLHSALAASNSPGDSAQANATTLTFGGTVYLHRWSKNGQNEFTPPNDKDLDRWRDMVTINVNEAVRNGDQLAAWPIRFWRTTRSTARSSAPTRSRERRNAPPST